MNLGTGEQNCEYRGQSNYNVIYCILTWGHFCDSENVLNWKLMLSKIVMFLYFLIYNYEEPKIQIYFNL